MKTKRFAMLVGLVLIFSMLFAACAESGQENQTAQPGVVGTQGAPFTQVTPGVVGPGQATEAPGVTQAPVVTPAVTEAPMATQPVSGTAIIPSTGAQAITLKNVLDDFKVQDKQGEDLGEIDNIIINVPQSRMDYAILNVGGFLGIGDKSIAIPWQAFKVNASANANNANDQANLAKANNILVLNVDKTQLENAPTIDLSTFNSDLDNGTLTSDWDTQFWDYWNNALHLGTRPAQPSNSLNQTTPMTSTQPLTATQSMTGTQSMTSMVAANPNFILASDLLGYNLNDPAGENWGQIQDAVVNLQSGKILYVIVDPSNGVLGLTDGLRAVPMDHVQLDRTNKAFVAGFDQSSFQGAPIYNTNQNGFDQGAFDNDVNTYWSGIQFTPGLNNQ